MHLSEAQLFCLKFNSIFPHATLNFINRSSLDSEETQTVLKELSLFKLKIHFYTLLH